MHAQQIARGDLDQFILAGNATFTLHNRAKGTHLTYKVRQCEDKPTLYFVSVLTGSNNEEDYTYLGTISKTHYAHGAKSRIGTDAPSAKAFLWFWRNRRILPPALEVWHEGRCGRCGRTLTTPLSVERGIGPECWEVMHGAA